MKNLISFSFILITLSASGQLPINSIQVEISESVELKVTEYVYEVSSEKLGGSTPFDFDFDDDFDDENYEEELTKPIPLTISQIFKALEGARFKVSVVKKGKYDIKAGQDADDVKYDNEVIEVRVSSLDELKRLSKFVFELDVAYGELKDVSFEEIENQYETLFPKMMQAAKEKASLIAATSGKKVGDVIQISEGVSGPSLYGDEMGEYFERAMAITGSLWKEDVPTSKKKKVKLTYVFELD